MGIIKKVIEKNMFFGAKAELFTLALQMRNILNDLPPLTSGEGERGGEVGKTNFTKSLKLTAMPPGGQEKHSRWEIQGEKGGK
jgi:hypothetical protein